jgi:hypothetical protein
MCIRKGYFNYARQLSSATIVLTSFPVHVASDILTAQLLPSPTFFSFLNLLLSYDEISGLTF